jgi:hypothetical protein
MSMQTETSRPSAYAPRNASNPAKLAGATVQAVDQIGLATSDEIERTAEEIMRGATEIADNLRELAETIREQTRIASAQVAGFCSKATSVLEGVQELQGRLALNGRGEADLVPQDDALSVPSFIRKGPSELIDEA